MNSKYFNELIREIIRTKNRKDLENLLDGLLTLSEKEEIPRRLQIVKKLKQGMSQREIAKELGVGISTVTRGSMEIKQGKFKSVKA